MKTEQYQPPTDAPELEIVLADLLRSEESGQQVDRNRLVAQYPHLAEDLGDFFANRDRLEQWTQPLRLDATPPPGPGKIRIFGSYELLEEIARGGMGIVYKARRLGTSRLVALKRMRPELISRTDRERFRTEAENAANLDHPNIVPIYDVGEHEDQLYFTMKLIDGPNLTSFRQEQPANAERQRWAAQLLVKVARAVHHAHQRRIIHRDLKLANILIDSEGQPHLMDFGLARRVEGDPHLTLSGIIVGTPAYMAPEQANCVSDLTTAVDIWNLGAILYELLTGRTPFQGRTANEILKQLQDPECEPTPVRHLNPQVDRDLEAICMKCLEKEPSRRYGSAEVLADHLELWLAGKPVPVRLPSAQERLARWCWNHPVASVLSVAAAVVLLVLTLTSVTVASDRETKLQREVLNHNEEMASHVASTVLLQLEHLSTPVVQMAELSRLRECLGTRDQNALQKLLEEKHWEFNHPKRGYALPEQEPPFKSWYVLDRKGMIVALSPMNPKILEPPGFAGRDYFQGALQHAKQKGQGLVHVSRVYRAVNDDNFKFALSAPVLGSKGEPIGVVATTIPTSSTLGTLRLANDRRIAVLIGQLDTNPPDQPATKELPDKHLILLHPAYRRPGEVAIEISNPALQAIRRPHLAEEELALPSPDAVSVSDDHYLDPVGRKLDANYRGRWLAGFAPVGNTEFVVVVQQRYDEAIGPDKTLARDLILRGGIALAVGVLLIGALIRHGVRRMLKP